MAAIDYIIIAVYLVGLLGLGLWKRSAKDESAGSFILAGRTLTLPAFIATLVSSWYGGILGVGEFSYLYGISNWLVFGLPYYLAALIFAYFLAGKARRAEVLTIPDRLDAVYGKPAAVAGSVILFLMTLPAAYILMLAVLVEVLFGVPLWVGALLGTVFSLVYVHLGGFASVIRTDIFQFILMFLGFALLLIFAVAKYGDIAFLVANTPRTHFTWHGGNSLMYILLWYFIALQTLIEPSFHQRCYAARNEATARKGILVSILCWFIFDLMTTSCGLYARAILPNLDNPVASYPELAKIVLPVGLTGIFSLALLATVMSTVDSYAFLAASTFSRDIIWRVFKVEDSKITYYTRVGLILSAAIALIIALYFDSVVQLWHHFGSVGTPALLIPLLAAFIGKRYYSRRTALWSIILSGALSFIWLISGYISGDGSYWLGIQPIFPGLALSLVIYLFSRKKSIPA